MGSSGNDSIASSRRVGEIIAKYVRACESGHAPDRMHLFLEHPNFAEELRNFFDLRDRTEALLKPLRDVAARVLNLRCSQCRNTIELVDDSNIENIRCPSCGSHFSLLGSSGIGQSGGLERIGQFHLLEQVGVGQFGTVWRARDLSLERTVAIKIPRSRHLNSADVEVLLREARVAAQLKHPHVVGIHEVGKHEDTIYIVSDFIEGTSLKEWLATNRPSLKESTYLCATIADALHYAHENGVVHRDLKPGNIMMDLVGEPHIVDFGLAKRAASELTVTLEGQILGTPAYMSPEQASGHGHEVDRTADVYSLGVILFELLTGELPFRGNRQMLLVRLINDAPPSPRNLNHKIPRDLETICLKCLEKQPHQRYESAREFADDCRRFLAGEPVRARPVSGLVKRLRWCHRNPWLAGLWATCTLLLVAIAVVASAGYLRTQAALGLAQEHTDTIERNLYFAEMTRAGRAAQSADGLAEVHRLLTHWRPDNLRVDQRGWEWHYLDSLLQQDLATLRGHDGGIVGLAWSPDGRHVASASYDWSIRVWASDGQALHMLEAHRGVVLDVDWNDNGMRLASASEDGTVIVWDTDSGQPVNTLRHAGPVSGVAWNRDGSLVASTSSNVTDGGPTGAVVTIWNAFDWKAQQRFELPLVGVKALRWNPAHNRIAVAPQRGQIVVIDATTGVEIARIGDSELALNCLDWSEDGTQLAYSYNFGPLVVWNMDQESFQQVAAPAGVVCVAWHPKKPLLAFASGNKEVQLHDFSSTSNPRVLRGHLSRVTAVCWHPEGDRIATGAIDGEIKVWNVSAESEFSEGAATVSWHPSGSQYASRINKVVVVRDMNLRSSKPIELYQHPWTILAVSWSPDGASLASLAYAGEAQIWDDAAKKIRLTIPMQLPASNSRFPGLLAWSPDSGRLAIPYDGRTIRIVNATSGKVVRDLQADCEKLLSIAWSPDGAVLAASSLDKKCRLWNPETGKVVRSFGNSTFNEQINSISWSPDSTQLACASSNSYVLVRSINEEDQWRYLSGHTTYVHAVAWSPDGTRIASADESGSVRVWDAATGEQTLTLQYPGGVSVLAWHPNGQSLAAAGYGGTATVRIWSTAVDPTPAVLW